MKFQTLVENLKSQVKDPVAKNNFTIENIAKFFESLVTGNEFLDNLEVKDLHITNTLEVNDILKVKEDAKLEIENLVVNTAMRSKIMNITDDNEMILDDEAIIRIKESPIAYKVRDIFEVIAFLKHMIKVCGNDMEKCDFNSLLKNSMKEEKIDLMKIMKKKYKDNKDEILKLYKNNVNINSNSNKNTKSFLKEQNDFKFKEKSSNTTAIFNDQNKIPTGQKDIKNLTKTNEDSEIEEILNYELKTYKENLAINDYESFLNNKLIREYTNKYYYE
jgi:hypothetical protein